MSCRRPSNASSRVTGPEGPISPVSASTSTTGRRRRAAAIASSSRVCAFSRARSSSSSAWKVARSTAAGTLGARVAPAAGPPGSGDRSSMAVSSRCCGAVDVSPVQVGPTWARDLIGAASTVAYTRRTTPLVEERTAVRAKRATDGSPAESGSPVPRTTGLTSRGLDPTPAFVEEDHGAETGRGRAPPVRATPAPSAGGSAEPRGQLVEQILLVPADPRHVAVRPQQHGGRVEFLADVDDVVDPICPPPHPEPARLVEQQSAAAVHQLV